MKHCVLCSFAVILMLAGLTLHEKPINIMQRNAIKRTHAPNSFKQWHGTFFSSFYFYCKTTKGKRTILECIHRLAQIFIIIYISANYVQVLNETMSHEPWAISINTRNECIIFCYGKQLSTKLTAVIFHSLSLQTSYVLWFNCFCFVENVGSGTMAKCAAEQKQNGEEIVI